MKCNEITVVKFCLKPIYLYFLSKIKDKIVINGDKNVVNKIPCYNCDNNYIGYISTYGKTLIHNHKLNVRTKSKDNTSLSEHLIIRLIWKKFIFNIKDVSDVIKIFECILI